MLVAAACGSSGKTSSSTTSTTGGSAGTDSSRTVIGPEGVAQQIGPLLAAPGPNSGKTVQGVQCETNEQTAYHIHAHLAVYVNGSLKAIPGGIGIPGRQAEGSGEQQFVSSGTCFYFLHTHSNSGVIHIESPDSRTFTLGQFFAVWGQPLSATQVGPDKGKVTTYVDGKVFTGDPTTIVLTVHKMIQLDVGSITPPQPKITWPDGL